MKVVLYTKKDCGLCVQAKQVLQEVQCEYSFQIEEIDIYMKIMTFWRSII